MNIQNIQNAVTKVGFRAVLLARKHGPTILTGAGVIGGVVTTVMASKATLKLDDILTDHALDMEDLKRIQPEPEAKEVAYIYAKTSLKVARLYAPAFSVGALSATSVLTAHGLMRQREASLTAAYVAIEKGFNEYRKRVEEAYGVDVESALRHGFIEERNDDTKKGEVKVVTKVAGQPSVYARFFDQSSPAWERTPDYNMFFLKSQQEYFNLKLQARGHVFLNEVYDALGLPRSSAGQVVGWVISVDGDNYIDFGLFDGTRTAVREFVNGDEAAILLDFNVDGVIYDKI